MTSPLIAREDQRKSIKVLKVFRVKCASVTGTAKRIVMAQNNRSLLVMHKDCH